MNIQCKCNLENVSSGIIKDLTTFGTGIVTLSFGVLTSAVSGIFKTVVAIIFAYKNFKNKEVKKTK